MHITKHLIPGIKHGSGGVRIWSYFVAQDLRTFSSHWVDHELLLILKCSRVRSEAICLTAKVWAKQVLLQDPKQIYNKKKRTKVFHWPIQSPEPTLIEMRVHKRIIANLEELKQHCEEEWKKYSSTTMCETDKVTEKMITSCYCC